MISEREKGLLEVYGAQLEQIARLQEALKFAAVLTRPCKRCREMLYIVRNGRRNGESPGFIPFTIDGRNHVTN